MTRRHRGKKAPDDERVARLLYERFDDMKQRVVIPDGFEESISSSESEDPRLVEVPRKRVDRIWRLAEIGCAALLVAGCVLVFTMHSPGTGSLHRFVAGSAVKQRIEGSLDSISDLLRKSFPGEERK